MFWSRVFSAFLLKVCFLRFVFLPLIWILSLFSNNVFLVSHCLLFTYLVSRESAFWGGQLLCFVTLHCAFDCARAVKYEFGLVWFSLASTFLRGHKAEELISQERRLERRPN